MQALRVLIIDEDGVMVAQCLEHDIVAQADDIETLQRRFADTLFMEAQDGLERIAPAPAYYGKLWETARTVGHAQAQEGQDIDFRCAA